MDDKTISIYRGVDDALLTIPIGLGSLALREAAVLDPRGSPLSLFTKAETE